MHYCLIDGDHAYASALADVRNFMPKLRADGWMVVQDCVPGGAVEAVVQSGLSVHMYAAILQPPVGHYVTVLHRDLGMVKEFQGRLGAALDKAEKDLADGREWARFQ